jgi:hypothetical protein
MKNNLFAILAILISNTIFGQGIGDAINYSKYQIDGTARFSAMGGAFTSLGGDISAIAYNPASGVVFSNGSMSFSYDDVSSNNNINFYGKESNSSKNYGNLNQIGVNFIYNTDNYFFPKVNFSISYNRNANFSNFIEYSGKNNTFLDISGGGNLYYSGYSTFAASIALSANGYTPGELSLVEGLAFDSYLIDINDSSSKYYNQNYPDYSDANPTYVTSAISDNTVQKFTNSTSGISGTTNYNFGFQVFNNIYVGLSYNSTMLDYKTNISIEEEYDLASDLKLMQYDNYISTIGRGNSFSIGAIYKLDNFRIGASYHSSTYFDLEDVYDYNISTKFRTPDNNGNTEYDAYSNVYVYNYSLQSPSRYNAGASLVILKRALISFDFERINYTDIKFGPKDEFWIENSDVSVYLKNSNNFKVGTEINIGFIAIRGGYNYIQSPYVEKEIESDTQIASFGAGINFMSWSFDIAYIRQISESDHYMYNQEMIDAATLQNNTNRVVMSLKFNL